MGFGVFHRTYWKNIFSQLEKYFFPSGIAPNNGQKHQILSVSNIVFIIDLGNLVDKSLCQILLTDSVHRADIYLLFHFFFLLGKRFARSSFGTISFRTLFSILYQRNRKKTSLLPKNNRFISNLTSADKTDR